MKVLIDTSVWSLIFRRKAGVLPAAERTLAARVLELAREGRAAIIGPVRQEILTGIRDAAQFAGLCRDLLEFPDEALVTADFESAAESANRCAETGIAGSSVDFLICAVSIRRDWLIFTRDHDFLRFARVLPIRML